MAIAFRCLSPWCDVSVAKDAPPFSYRQARSIALRRARWEAARDTKRNMYPSTPVQSHKGDITGDRASARFDLANSTPRRASSFSSSTHYSAISAQSRRDCHGISLARTTLHADRRIATNTTATARIATQATRNRSEGGGDNTPNKTFA